jgi:hypothetical protein
MTFKGFTQGNFPKLLSYISLYTKFSSNIPDDNNDLQITSLKSVITNIKINDSDNNIYFRSLKCYLNVSIVWINL